MNIVINIKISTEADPVWRIHEICASIVNGPERTVQFTDTPTPEIIAAYVKDLLEVLTL